MKLYSKTLLMAGAAMFIATGAYAEGYKHNNRMDSQSYNNRTQMNTQQQYYRLSNADVKDVQESLNDEGYNLAVDGIWGPRTTNAIRNFQQQNDGLRATGDLDSQTLAELDVDVDGERDSMW